jgi:hypothetical protein
MLTAHNGELDVDKSALSNVYLNGRDRSKAGRERAEKRKAAVLDSSDVELTPTKKVLAHSVPFWLTLTLPRPSSAFVVLVSPSRTLLANLMPKWRLRTPLLLLVPRGRLVVVVAAAVVADVVEWYKLAAIGWSWLPVELDRFRYTPWPLWQAFGAGWLQNTSCDPLFPSSMLRDGLLCLIGPICANFLDLPL